MLCAISGESPQEPVASRKSGHVFEKRLVEAYVTEHGKDPVTGEELAMEDLISLQTLRTVKPRPAALTSIPALLSAFQSEWDTIAFETHSLKQKLALREQENSTLLYEKDAATRVITRITKERDEAREALLKVSIGDRPGAKTNGQAAHDPMQVDGATLPKEIFDKIEETRSRLGSTRRKRPIPEDYMTADRISNMQPMKKTNTILPAGSRGFDISSGGDFILLAGTDGSVSVLAVRKQEEVLGFDVGGQSISSAACVDYESKDSRSFLTALALQSGEVHLYRADDRVKAFSAHSGPATAVAVHPCREILASVGKDKSVVLYDVVGEKVLSQIYTTTELGVAEFHPDGHLLAVGGKDGKVYMYSVQDQQLQATFDLKAPIQDISFSENGIWIAIVVHASLEVQIWDLRKGTVANVLQFGGNVSKVQFDWSGQFLAAGGGSAIEVQFYNRGAKKWQERPVLTRAVGVSSVKWGPQAKGLAILQTDGALNMVK